MNTAYVNSAILAVSFIAVIVLVVAAKLMIHRRRHHRRMRVLVGSHDVSPVPPERVAPRLNLRVLSAEEAERYTRKWRRIEELFVDDPRLALEDADDLVSHALMARGYPMRDFEQRAVDLSADHREVVENFRIAHTLARRAARGPASPESMRCAMQHYRELLEFVCESRLSDPAMLI